MLTSLAIIFLSGLLLGNLFQKIKLPSLLGMILVGILIGPYAFNLIDQSVLNISSDLRQIALVIILTRAGLSLDLSALKKVGRPALLMCFIPACFEILATIILAPLLLKVTTLDAAIMGSVLAAVSPAVIVPRMIKLMDEGYGTNHSIPQLILAGASVDDIFVIVLFTAFTSLAATGNTSFGSFLQIPISIILGIVVGMIIALMLNLLFKKFKMRDTIQIIVLLSFSFLLIQLENSLKNIIPISGLLAIMTLGIFFKQKNDSLANKLSNQYNKLWAGAEIILFVLVGATVDLQYALSAGAITIVLVVIALLFRMIGVACCLIKTDLKKKERFFCMIAYTPKATVQAAIGGTALAMGLSCGQIVLTVAILSILITAPFGAICIDCLYKRLLDKTKK